ncbi:sporulation delaying protein family toxin [Baia soyae]|uniref:SdpC family antimicrobial peptide n=1 Tax=Baia soyae TaxID=1544746 RepID=A0A4V2SW91_9BACL|nr:sporulation delaying protein family toxin [Baia soyae]TCP61546.1 SdpC family antimicrobial peptide [Baia soyae]
MVKKFISALLVLSMLVIGTSVYAKGNTAGFSKYDGETIYRGIAFGQGPVAELFPEIWTKEVLAKANTEESKKAVDLIMKEFKAKDSNFFKELESSIYARDLTEVDTTLQKGANLLQSIAKINSTTQNALGTGTGQCIVVAVGVAVVAVTATAVFNYGALVNAAAGVNVYAAVVAKTKVYLKAPSPDDISNEDSSLAREYFLQDLTERLVTS